MNMKYFNKKDIIRVFTRLYSNVEKQSEPKILQTKPETKENNIVNIRKEKRVLLLCSYLGQNYYGSSIQRENGSISYPTIQSELLKALHRVGAVLDLHLTNPKRNNFRSGSRTDKGVSALTQVTSVRMDVVKDYLESLNAALPTDIKVWLIQRTLNNFSPRKMCSFREYSYLCPSYAFAPEDADHLEFRIQPETKLAIQELIANYKGLHNFYNFTKGFKHDDRKLNKRILDMSIEDIFLSNKLEFVIFRVRGESFLYHQIRKMVGLVISVMKGKYPKSIFEKVFSSEQVLLPIAPGLGLVLMHQAFPEYNKLLKKLGLENIYPSFDVDPTCPKIQEFKTDFIFRHIIEKEVNQFSMLEWLNGDLKKHFEEFQS